MHINLRRSYAWRQFLLARVHFLRALDARLRTERRAERAGREFLEVNDLMAVSENELRVHRAHENPLIDELGRLAREWKVVDPLAWAQWVRHMTVAEHCTTSKARQLQIARWYRRKLPHDVSRAVDRLSHHYYNERLIVKELRGLQMRAGELPFAEPALEDDDIWAEELEGVQYGLDFERPHYINAFQDYVPKGEGIDMFKHMMAHFEARKTRLQHCDEEEFEELSVTFMRWCKGALNHGLNLPDVGGNFDNAKSQAILRLENYVDSPIKYEPLGPGCINDAAAAQDPWASDRRSASF